MPLPFFRDDRLTEEPEELIVRAVLQVDLFCLNIQRRNASI
jgi:hypothetical protein